MKPQEQTESNIAMHQVFQSQNPSNTISPRCDLGASVGCEHLSEHSTRRD